MKTIKAICAHCGGEFNARVSDIKKGGGRFCSKTCKGFGQNIKSVSERIWSKVDIKGDKDCWEYKEYRNGDGYGVFSIGNSKVLAHRVAYQDKKGDIPEGFRILHSCDNPPCCNPNHLFLGTQQDNIKDMHQKGRGVAPKGQGCHKAKLTNEQVVIIRKEFSYERKQDIAAKYNVHHNTIMAIVKNKTWRHLL